MAEIRRGGRMDYRVKCINKTNRNNPHERISNLGGTTPTGGSWKYDQPQVIRLIKTNVHTFYTLVNGVRADLILAEHNGHEYVKTKSDGLYPNNLLALPECP